MEAGREEGWEELAQTRKHLPPSPDADSEHPRPPSLGLAWSVGSGAKGDDRGLPRGRVCKGTSRSRGKSRG